MMEAAKETSVSVRNPSAETAVLDMERFLQVSGRLQIDDIDWATARQHGLSEKEKHILTYFSDIEGQTVMYLRDLLSTKAAEEPAVIAFLTMWNYEEFFHGDALAKLLKECGKDLGAARIANVRKSAGVSEALEAAASSVLSRIFADEFPAVHAAWGATQEITTLRGYEEIQRTTQNPILRTLCERIAKQERRHFAWYYNSAKERLAKSKKAQKLTYFLMSKFWTPVGAGVKTKDEVQGLIKALFPRDMAWKLAEEIDGKIGSLPGLNGIRLMRPYMLGCFPELRANEVGRA